MMGQTHKIGGFTFGLFFLAFDLCLPGLPIVFFSIYTPVFIIGCIFGALFPDIDTKKSTISRMLWPIAWPIWLTQKIIRKATKNKKSEFAKNVYSSFGHRGVAHWMFIAFIYFLIILLFAYLIKFEYINVENIINALTVDLIIYFLYGTAVGNISHLVLDLFNGTGIPLLAPFNFKRISFGKVKTGHKKGYKGINKFLSSEPSENVFIFILFLIISGLLIYIMKFK